MNTLSYNTNCRGLIYHALSRFHAPITQKIVGTAF